MRKEKNKLIQISLTITMLLMLLFAGYGYALYDSELDIEGEAYIRIDEEIRITNVSLNNVNDGLEMYNVEYSKNSIKAGIELNSNASTVTYKVEVTNKSNESIGIRSIEGLPEGIEYELSGYNLKENISGTKEFLLTIKNTKGIAGEYDIELNFDFRRIYTITYDNITNNGYPTTIMEKEDLNITFTKSIPGRINLYINGLRYKTGFTYINGVFALKNVTGNVTIELGESTLYDGQTFSKTIKDFVNGTSDATYSSEDTKITYIGFYSDEIPSGYTEEEFFKLPSVIVSTDGKVKAYNDSGKLYIYSRNKMYANQTMYSMFRNHTSLTEINLAQLDTSTATNMQSLFQNCKKLNSINTSNFNNSNVTNMTMMFYNCSSLTSLDLSNFNTSKVTSMSYMFTNCSSLTSLDLSNFNTSNVTNMSVMFRGCSKLTSLNVTSFNTAKVTAMNHMFYDCKSLTSLDLSSFDTSKVTSMSHMFVNCQLIKELDLSNFDTSKVTSIESMFQWMYALENIKISNFNTESLINMKQTFAYCSKLKTIDISNWNTSKVTDMYRVFYGTHSLERVLVGPNWITDNADTTEMFGDSSISSVTQQ